jgi:hypothetical protein
MDPASAKKASRTVATAKSNCGRSETKLADDLRATGRRSASGAAGANLGSEARFDGAGKPEGKLVAKVTRGGEAVEAGTVEESASVAERTGYLLRMLWNGRQNWCVDRMRSRRLDIA